eukprot:1877839-Pleurochrysis_carterae.AAC.1
MTSEESIRISLPCSLHPAACAQVTTKTSLPQFKFNHFSVNRRFRDFDWLHAQLGLKFPGAIVPPLPEKHAAQAADAETRGVDIRIDRETHAHTHLHAHAHTRTHVRTLAHARTHAVTHTRTRTH